MTTLVYTEPTVGASRWVNPSPPTKAADALSNPASKSLINRRLESAPCAPNSKIKMQKLLASLLSRSRW
jgi:hypothetical protein